VNLEAMRHVTLAAAAANSVDDVLRRIVDGIAECPNVVLARIWLVRTGKDDRGERRWLQLAASNGTLRTPGANPRRLDGDFARFEIGERKVGRIAASGQGMLLDRLGGGAEWIARPDWAAAEGVECFAGQPLVARGETLGVVGVFDRLSVPPADFAWLRTFADHAALAISNSRAFEEIDRLRRRLEVENDYLRTEVSEATASGDVIGSSPALRKVLQQIEMVAPTGATVLVLGESGVGKELVARAIHERSPRRERPLIKVNCGSVPGELFESEFFGHARGAFTGAVRDRIGRFELASGGTLFLDEIGEIPLAQQVKLLRVLQEGTLERVGDERTRTVDVRVVAATNRDLRAEAEAGRFRADLYYRLSVFPLEVPPLRERLDDVAALAAHFVRRAAQQMNVPAPRIPRAVVDQLRAYDWPGNVRELQHVVERAVILSRGGPLAVGELRAAGGPAVRHRTAAALADGDRLPTLAELRRRERDVIAAALDRSAGRVAGPGGAAELLGIPPTTLDSRIGAHGLRGHGRRASKS
jgi:transcriptional regulator with GAF, ATPase, and Fis domain